MTDVKFTNTSRDFSDLVIMAKDLAKGHKKGEGLTSEEKEKLKAYAENSSNTLTNDEEQFLNGLENTDNVENLKDSKFKPDQFKMKIDDKFIKKSAGYKADPGIGSNPMESEISSQGKAFNEVMAKKSVAELKKEILNDPRLKGYPALLATIQKLLDKLPNDKEAMIYQRIN